jgi:regulatory protein
MKITSLQQQVKNPDRVSVFVDGKYAFSLSYNEVISSGVKAEQEIDEAQLKRFKKLSEDGKLRARALEWLMNRPHSTRELKDYLYKKKADPELSDKLVEEFSSKGYLNDESFAQWYSELLTRRGKSNRAIKAELFKKGIGREVADAVLDETGDEEQRLAELVAKKSKLSRYRNDPQKLTQYLVAQGFNWQDVKAALKVDIPEE